MSEEGATSARIPRERGSRLGTALLVLVLGTGVGELAAQTRSDLPGNSSSAISGDVVVTGTRLRTDEEKMQEVTHALAEEPFLFGEHVTVTVADGVIRLEGVVDDVQELLQVLRVCRRTARGYRIVDELEVDVQLPDGG